MTRRKFVPLMSQEDLNRLLSYDPETGELRWTEEAGRHGSHPRVPGELATRRTEFEYNVLSVTESGEGPLRAARVIWRMMTGDDPELMEVDHKNRVPHDDRWENLRLANRSMQAVNTRHRTKSGHRGVWQTLSTGKWGAKISANGVHRTLGQAFSTREAAIAAYERAAEEMHGEYRAE